MRSLSDAFDATTLFKKVSKLKGVLVLDGENNDDDGTVFRYDGDRVSKWLPGQNLLLKKCSKSIFFHSKPEK